MSVHAIAIYLLGKCTWDATSSSLVSPEELEATVEEYPGQIAGNAPLTVRA